ncbi:E3 ubiquitin-protein ligase MARCHF9-like [Vanacampus margaritifer]
MLPCWLLDVALGCSLTCQLTSRPSSRSSVSQELRPDTGSSMTGVIGGGSWPSLTRFRREDDKEEEQEDDQEPGDKALQEDAVSFHSIAESGMRTPQCRICFQGPDKGELLSPCRCDGSVRYSHQSCLVRWIGETGSLSCELCCCMYQAFSIGTKNPLQWQSISLNLTEKGQISAIILGSVFLGCATWSIATLFAEFPRQNYIGQILYGLYVFMDVFCTGFIILQTPSVYRIIKRWHIMNQKWKVLNYEKPKDLTSSDSKGGEESNTVEVPDNGQEPRRRSRSCITLYVSNTILSILNRLRPNNLTVNHEVVMRMTTV